MKKLGITVLIIIAGITIFKFSPADIHRIFGYSSYSDKVFSPYWVNSEEYCYVRVKSYDTAISTWPTLFQMVDNFFRGPNASFYIYKVDINQPESKNLIRTITEKVSFGIPEVWQKISGEEFTFRRLDSGELVLLIRGRMEYIAYYMNDKGRVLKKRIFDFDYIEGKSIIDISPDGSKMLMDDRSHLFIKKIDGERKVLFSKHQLYYYDRAKWLDGENILIYRTFHFYAEKESEQDKYEVYVTDEGQKNMKLIYKNSYEDFEQIRALLLDGSFFSNQNLLFLSKIGIFKKEGEKWRILKDLSAMDFNLSYPNWSPDGERLVGVVDSKNFKVIEVEELLKD